MPTWWWGTHKDSFDEWCEYRRMMRLRLGHLNVHLTKKYDGRNDLLDHLLKWTKVYGMEWQPEWVHIFCHTLDIVPMNWYLQIELFHVTAEWDNLREGFLMTFSFEDEFKSINEALQEVKATIFRIS